MAKWSAFYPHVLVHVPGAPDLTIDQALRTAARDFLRRTRAWVVWLDPVVTATRPGAEYDFELPAEAELYAVERATQGGRPYPVQSFRQRESDPAIYGDAQGPGLVSHDRRTFVLTGGMPAAERVQVQVMLIPSASASGLPDELAYRHMEAIAEGAKARLMLTPNASFYNPDLAAVSQQRFEQLANHEWTQAYRGHTAEVPRARPKWV